ncbi:MAG TPA: single-stranded DNA-binding protein [Acidimicrobiia bacterium]|nr:single-stranded DNA-binding protein [Acidimicrobiia bacterium]
MTDNATIIVGNCTRDPELRFTPNGHAVANFGVAVNRRWQNRQTQEWEEATSFFDVTCWQQLAENVAESIQKGARVIVTGRLDQRSWETDNGDKRSKVEIIADDVAPSLRWATVPEVVKNPRRDGGGGFAGEGQYDSGPSQGSARKAGNYSDDAGTPLPDDEPF